MIPNYTIGTKFSDGLYTAFERGRVADLARITTVALGTLAVFFGALVLLEITNFAFIGTVPAVIMLVTGLIGIAIGLISLQPKLNPFLALMSRSKDLVPLAVTSHTLHFACSHQHLAIISGDCENHQKIAKLLADHRNLIKIAFEARKPKERMNELLNKLNSKLPKDYDGVAYHVLRGSVETASPREKKFSPIKLGNNNNQLTIQTTRSVFYDDKDGVILKFKTKEIRAKNDSELRGDIPSEDLLSEISDKKFIKGNFEFSFEYKNHSVWISSTQNEMIEKDYI